MGRCAMAFDDKPAKTVIKPLVNIEDWLLVAKDVGPIMRCPDMQRDAAFLRYAARKIAQGEALMVQHLGTLCCAGAIGLSKHNNAITWLGVRNAYQRQGIASLLIKAALVLLDRQRPITLNTYPKDYAPGHAARSLYEKHGFYEKTGEVFYVEGYAMVECVLPPKQGAPG